LRRLISLSKIEKVNKSRKIQKEKNKEKVKFLNENWERHKKLRESQKQLEC